MYKRQSINSSSANSTLIECSKENILIDGSFKEGKHISNYEKNNTTKTPFSVVRLMNPIQSSGYVLRQGIYLEDTDKQLSTENKDISYKIKLDINSGERYIFNIWVTHDNFWCEDTNPFHITYLTSKENVIETSYKEIAVKQLGPYSYQTWHLLESIIYIPPEIGTVYWHIGYDLSLIHI